MDQRYNGTLFYTKPETFDLECSFMICDRRQQSVSMQELRVSRNATNGQSRYSSTRLFGRRPMSSLPCSCRKTCRERQDAKTRSRLGMSHPSACWTQTEILLRTCWLEIRLDSTSIGLATIRECIVLSAMTWRWVSLDRLWGLHLLCWLLNSCLHPGVSCSSTSHRQDRLSREKSPRFSCW